MNSVRSNNVSLKYERFATSGCKDTWMRKFEFFAKTQLLSVKVHESFLALLNQIKCHFINDVKNKIIFNYFECPVCRE